MSTANSEQTPSSKFDFTVTTSPILASSLQHTLQSQHQAGAPTDPRIDPQDLFLYAKREQDRTLSLDESPSSPRRQPPLRARQRSHATTTHHAASPPADKGAAHRHGKDLPRRVQGHRVRVRARRLGRARPRAALVRGASEARAWA
ncbi:hypothetical protein AX16_010244 [Volvariella volvacea WC 439]|nr:hypothetical protein AX16_010244 [Volvariella volvacea WC 439]